MFIFRELISHKNTNKCEKNRTQIIHMRKLFVLKMRER